MQNIFFVSDTHFGHSNVIQYSCRPFFDIHDMNESMIESWNALVKHNDQVYHLGDFAFMSFTKMVNFIDRLNGNIHLILGNHDKEIFKKRNLLLEQGKFASIQHYRELKIADRTFVLFHFGQRVWNKSHYSSIHLYGHSHGALPPYGLSVDVGVDCKEITSEYRPIHVDEILQYMSKRQSIAVDNHMS